MAVLYTLHHIISLRNCFLLTWFFRENRGTVPQRVSPFGSIFLPCPCPVLLEDVLVEGPQVGDHAPIVQLGGSLPPPGNVLPTVFAASDMRLCSVHQEKIPQHSGFRGHDVLNIIGILWIKTQASHYIPGQRDVMNTIGPRGLWMYSLLSTPKILWAQGFCFGCCEAGF